MRKDENEEGISASLVSDKPQQKFNQASYSSHVHILTLARRVWMDLSGVTCGYNLCSRGLYRVGSCRSCICKTTRDILSEDHSAGQPRTSQVQTGCEAANQHPRSWGHLDRLMSVPRLSTRVSYTVGKAMPPHSPFYIGPGAVCGKASDATHPFLHVLCRVSGPLEQHAQPGTHAHLPRHTTRLVSSYQITM